jgi:hypothetical protein
VLRNFLYLDGMQRISLFTLLLVSCFCISGKPGKKLFTFRILQDGIEVPLKKNTVTLSKKPFAIEFSLKSPMGILVSASFDGESYRLAKNKKIAKIPGFRETGMAEGKFNQDKEIMISDEAPNYWFYDNDETHRFDRVHVKKDSIICTRTIEKLYRVGQKLTIPLDKVPGDLYLVLLVKQRGKSEDTDTELQRERLVIKWN